MGFSDVRIQVIACLELGNVQHEARDGIDQKNLLQAGSVSVQEVVLQLKKCRGTEYSCSPHHQIPTVAVHEFKPALRDAKGRKIGNWYIKCYVLEPDAWFISVHR